MDSERQEQEQEQERDMINVVFGSRVRYGDGTEALVTRVCNNKRAYPIRTGRGVWHRKDGTCCISDGTADSWDIVEIITSTPTEDDVKAAEALIIEAEKEIQALVAKAKKDEFEEAAENASHGVLLSCEKVDTPTIHDLFAMAALTGLLAHGTSLSVAVADANLAANEMLKLRA